MNDYKRQLSILELECQCLFQELGGKSYEVNQLMVWYAQNNPQLQDLLYMPTIGSVPCHQGT